MVSKRKIKFGEESGGGGKKEKETAGVPCEVHKNKKRDPFLSLYSSFEEG